MKKLLFTLMCLLGVLGVSAADYTVDLSALTWEATGADETQGFTTTATVDGVAFKLVMQKNASSNTLVMPSSDMIRVYKSAKFFVEAPEGYKMTKVVLGCYANYAAEATLGEGWTGGLDGLVYTATCAGSATFELLASEKQMRLQSIAITAEKQGTTPVDPTPDDPVNPDLPGVAEGADAITPALFGIAAGQGDSFKAYTATGETGTTYAAVLRNGAAADAAPVLLMNAVNEMSGVVNTTSTGVARKVTVYWNAATPGGQMDIYGSQSAYVSPTQLYSGERTVLATARKANAVDGATTVTLPGNWAYVGIRPVAGKVLVDRIDIEWEEAPVVLLPAGLSFPAASYNAKMGQAFTAPTLTKATDAAVTYTSGNTAVATVDAATGAVTLTGAGTTVITATAEATAAYEAGTASYTLTVAPADAPNPPVGDEKTDVLTTTSLAIPTGKPESGYGSYTDFTMTSTATGAAYAANACSYPSVNNEPVDVVQLRSKNDASGIVVTKSAGNVGSVTVDWNSNTAAGRTLNVYGSATAYTSPAELYADATAGTLLGTIVNGTSTSLTVSGEYPYVGIRSAEGAVYLNSVTIAWGEGGETPIDPPTPPVGDEVTDEVVASIFGIPTGAGSNYETVTSKAQKSGAIYNANLMTNPKEAVLQMRWTADDANKQAGIVTTTSGGTVKSIKVKWNSTTTAARVLAVYGSHTAYTSYTDLQDEAKAGTELAQLAVADAVNNVSEFTLPEGYEYIAFRSTAGALYLNGIDIVWNGKGGDVPNPPVGDSDLAKWLEAKLATDTPIASALTAVYQNGKDLWVTDGNDAWALVYGELTQTYSNGDVIAAGATGKYEEYNGMPEIIPVASTFGAPTAGTPVVAQAVEIGSITAADAARYVRLEGVTIAANPESTDGLNFIASDGTAEVAVRNRYSKTVTITESSSATIYGFVGLYNGTVQIYPVIIENDEPGPGPGPVEGKATFDFTAPASLSPAQATPGEGADGAVNVTSVVFTDGPVSVSFFMPADLVGKSKDPRLYLYKGAPELRMYSGTSMTVAGASVEITGIEFQVGYDDNINANVSTGTVTTGTPTLWAGQAASVTFDWTATSKVKKMIVSYAVGAGIDAVAADADAPVEFYNLQGVRVENPSAGLYIRRQGRTVSKVLVK